MIPRCLYYYSNVCHPGNQTHRLLTEDGLHNRYITRHLIIRRLLGVNMDRHTYVTRFTYYIVTFDISVSCTWKFYFISLLVENSSGSNFKLHFFGTYSTCTSNSGGGIDYSSIFSKTVHLWLMKLSSDPESNSACNSFDYVHYLFGYI